MLFLVKTPLQKEELFLNSIRENVTPISVLHRYPITPLSSPSRDSSLLPTYRKSIPSPLGKADSDMKDMEDGLIYFARL